MNIAIIGCGYIGSAVGSTLVAASHHVVGTTTTPIRSPDIGALGIVPAIAELADVPGVRSLLADRETVFMTVAPGNDVPYRTVYLEGVENLLRAIEDTDVRHVVYTSSTSVYGQDDGEWVDEDAPTEPQSENAKILVKAERTLRSGAARLGIQVTILRVAGIYGPERGPDKRVREYAGQLRTDGDAYVNLIHRDDIVRACAALLDTPFDGVLNLSNGNPTLRRELYDQVIATAGLTPIRWAPGGTPPRRGKRVSNRRMQQVLGVTPSHPTFLRNETTG